MALLKVRLEMAKFLQETISESGFPGSDHEKAAQEFADFFRKVNWWDPILSHNLKLNTM